MVISNRIPRQLINFIYHKYRFKWLWEKIIFNVFSRWLTFWCVWTNTIFRVTFKNLDLNFNLQIVFLFVNLRLTILSYGELLFNKGISACSYRTLWLFSYIRMTRDDSLVDIGVLSIHIINILFSESRDFTEQQDLCPLVYQKKIFFI